MKTLYTYIRNTYTIATLAFLLCCVSEMKGQTTSPVGFEDNSVGDWVGGGASEGVAMNSATVRTGTKSLAMTTSNSGTANKFWYSNDPFAASSAATYVHYIYWAKATDAVTSVDASMQYAGTTNPNGTGTASNGTAAMLSNSVWTRVTHKANGATRWYFPAPRKTTTNATTFYMDDIVLYTSTSSTTDIIAPASTTAAKGTTTGGLSWTNGADAGTGATGVQNTLIFKRTAGTVGANDLSLNHQAIYSLTSTQGPKTVGNWELQSASVAAAATTYNTGSYIAGEEWAIVHRDLAYNYSSPTYVVVVPPTILIKEVASKLTYESNSSFDMGTSYNATVVSKTFRLYNTGLGTLNISSAVLSTGTKFTKTASPAATVNAGDSTSFTLQFSPGATAGIFTDVFTIVSNDVASPYIVNLSGMRANFVLPYTYESGTTSAASSATELTHDYTLPTDAPSNFTLGNGAALDATHFYRDYKAFQSEGNCLPNGNSAMRIGQGSNALKLALASCGVVTLKWCANGYRKVKITDETGNVYEQSIAYLPGAKCYTTQTVVNKAAATTIKVEFLGNDTNMLTSLYYLNISPYDNAVKSSAKNIIDFSTGIAGESVHIYDNLVSVSVPTGTNLASLAPSLVKTSPFASVLPAQGVAQNFTNNVTYTVTAEDGSKKVYTVTITQEVNYGTALYADSIVYTLPMNMKDHTMEILEVANGTCNIPISGKGTKYTLHFLDWDDKPIEGYKIEGVSEICIGSVASYKITNAPTTNQPKYLWRLSGANKNLFKIIGDSVSETLTIQAPSEYTISALDFAISIEFLPCNCELLKGLDTLSLRVTKDSPDKITGIVADCAVDGMLTLTAEGSDNATAYNWSFNPSFPVVTQNDNYIVVNIGTNYNELKGSATTQNGCGITADTTSYTLDYATTKSKWTGATDNDWSKNANWTARVPKACTDVTIPDVGAGVDYPIIGAGNGVCHYITFEPGGAVLNLQRLDYVRAYVQTQLQRNKWYTITPPLKSMFSGDYYFTGMPKTMIKLFDDVNPDKYGEPATAGTWTYGFANLAVPLTPGIGYAFLVDTISYNYPFATTSSNVDYFNSFPRVDASGNLLTVATPISGVTGKPYYNLNQTMAKDTSIAYRFAMEDASNQLQNVSVPIKAGLNLVGNPMMSHLDFEKLYLSNSGIINNKVKFWNGTTFVTYMTGTSIASDMSLTHTRIAPMQAFFVEGTGVGTMNINLENHYVVDESTKLRSASTGAKKVLYVKSSYNNLRSTTAIALNDAASNAYGNDDAFKLFTQFKMVPEVYTTVGNEALDINQFSSLPYMTPLGIKTDSRGKIALNFSNAQSFDDVEVTLINTLTGEQQDLKTNPNYELDFDGTPTDGSLFVEFRKASTTTDTPDAKSCGMQKCIQVFAKDRNTISVISPDNEKIQKLTIWEQDGKQLFNKLDVDKSEFETQLETNSNVIMVRVETINRTYVVKVFMK